MNILELFGLLSIIVTQCACFATDFQANELINPQTSNEIESNPTTILDDFQQNEGDAVTFADTVADGDGDAFAVEDYDMNFDPFETDNDDDAEYFDGRIVGGSPVSIQQFPYQASVQQDNAHICGGTIVASNLIITAAHCVERPNKPNLYRVRVGSSSHKHGGQLIAVENIIRNELYSEMTMDHDVAIIVLATNVTFNRNVKAIRIAQQTDAVPANRRLFISGWGVTSEMGNVSPILRYVSVRLLDENACMKSYKQIGRITARMFCAGLPNGGRDSCQGDSGGPLVSYIDGKPILFGIVSWGIGCAQKGYPGVYAKVSALRPWLNGRVRVLRRQKQKKCL